MGGDRDKMVTRRHRFGQFRQAMPELVEGKVLHIAGTGTIRFG